MQMFRLILSLNSDNKRLMKLQTTSCFRKIERCKHAVQVYDEMFVCKQAIYHGSGAKQKSKQHGSLGRSYYCNMIILRSECTQKINGSLAIMQGEGSAPYTYGRRLVNYWLFPAKKKKLLAPSAVTNWKRGRHRRRGQRYGHVVVAWEGVVYFRNGWRLRGTCLLLAPAVNRVH